MEGFLCILTPISALQPRPLAQAQPRPGSHRLRACPSLPFALHIHASIFPPRAADGARPHLPRGDVSQGGGAQGARLDVQAGAGGALGASCPVRPVSSTSPPQAMEKAVKDKRMKEDNKLRQESLDAAIAQKEDSLRQVQRMIVERKEAAAQLRELQDKMKQARIDECQREAEVH